jgi:hypothetical protein
MGINGNEREDDEAKEHRWLNEIFQRIRRHAKTRTATT